MRSGVGFLGRSSVHWYPPPLSYSYSMQLFVLWVLTYSTPGPREVEVMSEGFRASLRFAEPWFAGVRSVEWNDDGSWRAVWSDFRELGCF